MTLMVVGAGDDAHAVAPAQRVLDEPLKDAVVRRDFAEPLEPRVVELPVPRAAAHVGDGHGVHAFELRQALPQRRDGPSGEDGLIVLEVERVVVAAEPRRAGPFPREKLKSPSFVFTATTAVWGASTSRRIPSCPPPVSDSHSTCVPVFDTILSRCFA